MEIGSFGFNSDEVRVRVLKIIIHLSYYYQVEYVWSDTPLSMDDALELAQYRMINWKHGNKIVKMKNGDRSVIYLNFDFRRAIGFYILQVNCLRKQDRSLSIYQNSSNPDTKNLSDFHEKTLTLGIFYRE